MNKVGAWKAKRFLFHHMYGEHKFKIWPNISSYEYQEEQITRDVEFLVIASDGLWDVISNEVCSCAITDFILLSALFYHGCDHACDDRKPCPSCNLLRNQWMLPRAWQRQHFIKAVQIILAVSLFAFTIMNNNIMFRKFVILFNKSASLWCK